MTFDRVDTQTDKAENKTLPCTYPDCNNGVIVNKFYAPAKARCNDHSGVTTTALRNAVAVVGKKTSTPAAPNRSVADLRCPLCDTHLEVIRISEAMGFVTFACRPGSGGCGSVVEVKPNWSGLVIPVIPEAFKALVGPINDSLSKKAKAAIAKELKGDIERKEEMTA